LEADQLYEAVLEKAVEAIISDGEYLAIPDAALLPGFSMASTRK
jgi:hypothetical protein